MNDPSISTSPTEDTEAVLWAEVLAAREELRTVRSRRYKNMDERFDRIHDTQQAQARLDEAGEAWARHINETEEIQ